MVNVDGDSCALKEENFYRHDPIQFYTSLSEQSWSRPLTCSMNGENIKTKEEKLNIQVIDIQCF